MSSFLLIAISALAIPFNHAEDLTTHALYEPDSDEPVYIMSRNERLAEKVIQTLKENSNLSAERPLEAAGIEEMVTKPPRPRFKLVLSPKSENSRTRDSMGDGTAKTTHKPKDMKFRLVEPTSRPPPSTRDEAGYERAITPPPTSKLLSPGSEKAPWDSMDADRPTMPTKPKHSKFKLVTPTMPRPVEIDRPTMPTKPKRSKFKLVTPTMPRPVEIDRPTMPTKPKHSKFKLVTPTMPRPVEIDRPTMPTKPKRSKFKLVTPTMPRPVEIDRPTMPPKLKDIKVVLVKPTTPLRPSARDVAGNEKITVPPQALKLLSPVSVKGPRDSMEADRPTMPPKPKDIKIMLVKPAIPKPKASKQFSPMSDDAQPEDSTEVKDTTKPETIRMTTTAATTTGATTTVVPVRTTEGATTTGVTTTEATTTVIPVRTTEEPKITGVTTTEATTTVVPVRTTEEPTTTGLTTSEAATTVVPVRTTEKPTTTSVTTTKATTTVVPARTTEKPPKTAQVTVTTAQPENTQMKATSPLEPFKPFKGDCGAPGNCNCSTAASKNPEKCCQDCARLCRPGTEWLRPFNCTVEGDQYLKAISKRECLIIYQNKIRARRRKGEKLQVQARITGRMDMDRTYCSALGAARCKIAAWSVNPVAYEDVSLL